MKKLTMVASFVAIALSAQANATTQVDPTPVNGGPIVNGIKYPTYVRGGKTYTDYDTRSFKDLGWTAKQFNHPLKLNVWKPHTLATSTKSPQAHNPKTNPGAGYSTHDSKKLYSNKKMVVPPSVQPQMPTIQVYPKKQQSFTVQQRPALDPVKVAQAKAVPTPAITTINALSNPTFTGTGKAPGITKTYTTVSGHAPSPAQAPAKMAVPPKQITIKPNAKQVITGTSIGQAIPPKLTVKKPNGYYGFTSHSTTLNPITTIPKNGQSATPAQPVTPAKAPALAPSKAPVLAPAQKGTATPVSAPMATPKPMAPGLAPDVVPQKQDINQTPKPAQQIVVLPNPKQIFTGAGKTPGQEPVLAPSKAPAQVPALQATASPVSTPLVEPKPMSPGLAPDLVPQKKDIAQTPTSAPVSVHAPKKIAQAPLAQAPAKGVTAPKLVTQFPAPQAPAKTVSAPKTVAQVPAPQTPAKAVVAPKTVAQVPAPLAPAKGVPAPQKVTQVPPARLTPAVSAPTAAPQSQPAKPSALAVANTNSISTNTQHVADNHRAIANNETRIDHNSQAITQNSNDIQDLRKAFEHQAEVMDGAMAQGIATSSLVMPYNVGKISTTVALGHSGSANAIAGGVGMRFTENFTARANMAYDDGSENVSIGAGVGYEF